MAIRKPITCESPNLQGLTTLWLGSLIILKVWKPNSKKCVVPILLQRHWGSHQSQTIVYACDINYQVQIKSLALRSRACTHQKLKRGGVDLFKRNIIPNYSKPMCTNSKVIRSQWR